MAMVVMTISAIAQTDMFSVCGIALGTPKDEALSILRDRFGYSAVREDVGNIEIHDGAVGGIHYKYLTFNFAWVNGASKFNGAFFSTPYELNEEKDAIEKRDLIKSVYEQKYTIKEYVNDDGFKSYYFGNGNIVNGAISIFKGKSEDGIIRLHTTVIYIGPYNAADDI